MNQLGMQMPGAQRRRTASPNIYTGLLLVAVLCLLAAVLIVGYQANKVGPADQGEYVRALHIHEEGQVRLPDN